MRRWVAIFKKNWAFIFAANVLVYAFLISNYKPVAAEYGLDTPRIKILLLGDSYTAGNGARKSFGQTDNFGPMGCYRSNSNWGSQYATMLKEKGHNVTIINRSCSGATSNDLLYGNATSVTTTHIVGNTSNGIITTDTDEIIKAKLIQASFCDQKPDGEAYYQINIHSKQPDSTYFECRKYLKPQLESVDTSVDLVLMTLGGNDIEFADVVAKCFAPIVADGEVCNKRIGESQQQLLAGKTGSFKNNLQEIFNKLKLTMRPDAKVVLLNYPYLAKNENFEIGNRFSFGSYRAAENVRSLGSSGDELQRSLIPPSSTSKANIYYFDKVKEHFIGHEPDMTDPIFNNIDRWINTFNNRMIADWFHFNPEGHTQVAKVLNDQLTNQIGKLPAHSLTDYDVTFVFNESGDADWYGRDDVANKKMLVSKIIDKVQQQSASSRFSLIGYNLWTGSSGRTGPKQAILKEFTNDKGSFNTQLNKFNYPLGQTSPGALKDALKLANTQQWRPGVKKLIYIIGKTKLDDGTSLLPELYSEVLHDTKKFTMAQIIPIRFTRTTSDVDEGAVYLAQATNSQPIQSFTPDRYSVDPVVAAANSQTITTPYAWAGEGITSAINQPIILNGSGSYDSTGIVKYEWDVNDDGIYDITTTNSTTEYTFTDAYDGLVRLRVTNAGGAQSVATFSVLITKDGDVITDENDNCPLDWNEDQADADQDGIGDICDDSPGIPGYLDSSASGEPVETTIDIVGNNTIPIQSSESDDNFSKQVSTDVKSPAESLDGTITRLAENEFSPVDVPALSTVDNTSAIKKSFDIIRRNGYGKWLAGGVVTVALVLGVTFRAKSSGIIWYLQK
jgi:lysophospholipase L1-like esterase